MTDINKFNLFSELYFRKHKNPSFRLCCDVTDFTQQDIANILNVSLKTVNRWYNGETILTPVKEDMLISHLFTEYERSKNEKIFN